MPLERCSFKKGDKIKPQLHLALIIGDFIFKTACFFQLSFQCFIWNLVRDASLGKLGPINTVGKPNPLSQRRLTHAFATSPLPSL